MVPVVQRVPFIRQRGSICKLLLGRQSSQRRLHILSAEAVENCVHTAPLVISWDIQRLDARSETTGVSRCLFDMGTNSNCFTYIVRIAHQSQLLKPTTYFSQGINSVAVKQIAYPQQGPQRPISRGVMW